MVVTVICYRNASFCDDGVSAGIWVIHTGPISRGELVTLFGSDCDDGVSAGIYLGHMYNVHTGAK